MLLNQSEATALVSIHLLLIAGEAGTILMDISRQSILVLTRVNDQMCSLKCLFIKRATLLCMLCLTHQHRYIKPSFLSCFHLDLHPLLNRLSSPRLSTRQTQLVTSITGIYPSHNAASRSVCPRHCGGFGCCLLAVYVPLLLFEKPSHKLITKPIQPSSLSPSSLPLPLSRVAV